MERTRTEKKKPLYPVNKTPYKESTSNTLTHSQCSNVKIVTTGRVNTTIKTSEPIQHLGVQRGGITMVKKETLNMY